MFRRSEGAERLVGVHGSPEDQTQDPASLVVDRRFRNFPALDHIEIRVGKIIVIVTELGFGGKTVGERTHFDVEAVERRLLRVVSAAPVSDDHAVKVPFSAKDIIEQPGIVAAMLVPDFIIGAHDAPCLAILHCASESRKIYLIEGAVGNLHVDVASPLLLVVQGEMLYASRHAVFLEFLNIRHRHFTGEIRILAHILEVSAVKGRAVDVYAGSEQHVLLAVTCLFTDTLAI